MFQLSVFLTDFGWFGLLGHNNQVVRIKIGHVSADDVRREMSADLQDTYAEHADVELADWAPQLRRQLERYASGHDEDFSHAPLQFENCTPFQQQVIEETRRIPFGETLTYAQLAERAGSPRSARAVGNVMANNRFPIIVPCHRVVASGGGLGGFSAPQGISLKQQMLNMEAAACTVAVH